jgi:hypothetical protein
VHAAGLYDKIFNVFGTPDLLDDVTDHWSSGNHEAEKQELLMMFYELAKAKQWRITMISGDVHVGAYTYLCSPGKLGTLQATDPGFMPQIVTSGIGNKPPEDFVVHYVASCGKKPHVVTPQLTQKVGSLFKSIKSSIGDGGFNARMNFCELGVKTVGTKGAKGLEFTMVFLGGHHVTGEIVGDRASAVIPPLLAVGDPQAPALEMDESKAPKSRHFVLLKACCTAPCV